MQLAKSSFVFMVVLTVIAAQPPPPAATVYPESVLIVHFPPSESDAILNFCPEPNQGGECFKMPIPRENGNIGDPPYSLEFACVHALSRYVKFWTRSVHIEDPQNRTWSCNMFPYRKPMELIPSIGEIHNLAVCPSNFGGAENTVVVTKENPLNDIEAITEVEGRFKQGIGGFICRCEDVRGEPCKFE